MEVCTLLENLSTQMLNDFKHNVLPFWMRKVPDARYGGYFGRIDSEGNPIEDADKGGILNMRILWTFASAYNLLGEKAYLDEANRAFDYIRSTFFDLENGGIYWMVTANGEPSDPRKHVYANSFAIYALAEFYAASKNEIALSLAMELFHQIDKVAHDEEYKGYFEAFDVEWNKLDDVRLSEKDANFPKSMNTHLHVLEAFTTLYRHSKDEDVKERLIELIELFLTVFFDEEKGNLINFLSEDWKAESKIFSYGHNIEASWLVCEALDELDEATKVRLKDKVHTWALKLVNSTIEEGLAENGGVYNEVHDNGILDTDKAWWPQAEAIIGLINAYEFSGNEKFVTKALEIWDFIDHNFIDKEGGEWFEQLDKNNAPYKMDKVRAWKCPYHNGRAALEIYRRFKAIQTTAKAS